MVWRYRAVNDLACEVKGIAFGCYREVLFRLEREKLHVITLEPDLVASCQDFLWAQTMTANGLSIFFKDLGNMLEAGLTLTHVLDTFREGCSAAGIRAACVSIKEDLAGGRSLAQGMEGARIFPRLAINAVRSGERSGQLVLACRLLAEYYQLTGTLKGKIIRAVTYPLVIFIFLVAAMVYVAQAVVPQIATLLPPEAMQGGLTRGMLATSFFLRANWPLLLTGLFFVLVLLATAMSCYRRSLDAFVERLPVLGVLRRDMDIALCFFDIYILLKSGIPLDMALAEAAAAGRTRARQKLHGCVTALTSGHTLAQALAGTDYFPALLVETIRIGEEIGAYGDYCERVFRYYYRSFETRLNMAVGWVQPLLLALCALFLMGFAFAFLRPIYGNLGNIGMLKP